MKFKYILPALCAGSISFMSAQTAAPEKPVGGKKEKSEKAEKKAEIKAETPVEKQAFKIFDLIATLPDILGEVKDDATLAAAEKKMEEMFKKMKKEETALLKLEVPNNEARKKLSAKMKTKEKVMNEKMMPVMMAMQTLPPETAIKLGPMMQKFGARMNEFEPTMNKYFQPDEKKEKK